jgi:hypothetical protein
MLEIINYLRDIGGILSTKSYFKEKSLIGIG